MAVVSGRDELYVCSPTRGRSPLGRITDFGFARRMDADGRVVVPAQTRNLPIRIGAPESLASDDAEYSAKVHRVLLPHVWVFVRA